MPPKPLEAAGTEGAAPRRNPRERLSAGRRKTVAEEEGPEPARIPTSLTATLREQGPALPAPRLAPHAAQAAATAAATEAAMEARRPPPAEGQRGPQPGPAPEARPAEPAPRRRAARPCRRPAASRVPRRAAQPSISDLLKEGQEIIVQIAKEPLGQKGARITSHIALPGRFLVYMPTVDHIGVSRKIPSDDERLRLKRDSAGQPHRHSGRLHRAHRRRRPHAKKNCAPT